MLETEIKKLTAAVTRLADLMENNATKPVAHTAKTEEPEAEKPVTQTAETEEPEATGYTTDDIKSMALAISRKDRSKQKDIKAKLAEHDAKIATDLSGDALHAVGEWLSALKEGVGA